MSDHEEQRHQPRMRTCTPRTWPRQDKVGCKGRRRQANHHWGDHKEKQRRPPRKGRGKTAPRLGWRDDGGAGEAHPANGALGGEPRPRLQEMRWKRASGLWGGETFARSVSPGDIVERNVTRGSPRGTHAEGLHASRGADIFGARRWWRARRRPRRARRHGGPPGPVAARGRARLARGGFAVRTTSGI